MALPVSPWGDKYLHKGVRVQTDFKCLVYLTLESDAHMTKMNRFEMLHGKGASQVTQWVTNSPANAGDAEDMHPLSLEGEDPLEEGMATHSSILARRIPWREEPGRLQSVGSQRVRHE